MKVYIGADHAGFKMKEALQASLKAKGYDVVDLGAFNEEPTDYPVIAREVSEKVYENQGARGILICGSGEGMCMTANKHRGVRAALADTPLRAKTAREHNDANIVCIGARFTDEKTAEQIVEAFLSTQFSSEKRHKNRVEMIEGNEK